MMDEPVDHGSGHAVITEDFALAPEPFVAGDDQAGPVAGETSWKNRLAASVQRGVAHLVDSQHPLYRILEVSSCPTHVTRLSKPQANPSSD
jgi:hypothetical protein